MDTDEASHKDSEAQTLAAKQTVGHTNSLPGSQHISPVDPPPPNTKNVFKHQSFRIKRTKEGQAPPAGEQQPPCVGPRWSFGGVAKAVGTGVSAFGSGVVQGTKAVGSGVVQGTKAVGSGVVEGTKVVGSGAMMVGTGVVEGTKAVGSGVVEGTKVVASVSKDVTLAAGNKVCKQTADRPFL